MIGPLVAIGDLFVDLVVDLADANPPLVFASLSSSTNTFASIDRAAGGSALAVASAWASTGFSSGTVIGMVGGDGAGSSDADGQYLEQAAVKVDVGFVVARSRDSRTGRAIVAYSSSGERLMVSDRGANVDMQPGDLSEEMFATVRQAAVLHISGYTFLQAGRRDAARLLALTARESGALVAMDYAPHDLHRYMAPCDLIDSASEYVDCAFVELPLAARLSGCLVPEVGDLDVTQVVAWWGSRFKHVVIHLTPQEAVVASGGSERTVRTPYHPGLRSRGQSARVQAGILAEIRAGRSLQVAAQSGPESALP